MLLKKGISVITVVYNEESRIDSLLGSMLWSDDIIVIDKSSTDKTHEIALRYTPNVISVPYTDANDIVKHGIDKAKHEWVMTVTASDIIHPLLVDKVLLLINDISFDYDIIALPFSIYVFGINDKRSPWSSTTKKWLFKKRVAIVRDEIHKEISFSSVKIYEMKSDDDERLSHLTHANTTTFLERHIRYTKIEVNNYTDERQGLRQTFKQILSSLYIVFFKKKCFLLGWDGIALGLAYVSYYILKYLFVWEKFRGKGDSIYASLRKKNIEQWESFKE